MENQPLQANTQPLGYSIVFSPDKPHVPVPKCVADYKSKPADSPGTLQKKLDSAAERKKVAQTTLYFLYVFIHAKRGRAVIRTYNLLSGRRAGQADAYPAGR